MSGEEPGAMGRDPWVEALTWRYTLLAAEQRDLTCFLRREWQDWCSVPENRRIFDDLNRLMSDRDRYRERHRPGRSQLDEDDYDLSVPITEWRRTQPQAQKQASIRRSSIRRWRWWLCGGLGMASIAVLLALWPMRYGLWDGGSGARVYETNAGRIERVHLRDGSSLTLGGKTKLSVAFSPRRRFARLIEGEARFEVAHNPHWPFVVTAGSGTITAVGTAFLVNRESDRVVVTVTEGTVAVVARPHSWALRIIDNLLTPALAPVRINRGEELAFGDNGTLQPVRRADILAATAWTRGRLMFDDQPLRYVVEIVDRYSSRHIAVDASAGALRFSGVVFDDEIEDWLQSLKTIFPVTVEERGAEVRIRRRHSISIPR